MFITIINSALTIVTMYLGINNFIPHFLTILLLILCGIIGVVNNKKAH